MAIALTVVLCLQYVSGSDDEYDRMHPLVHVIGPGGKRTKRADLPPIYFKSPHDEEKETKYWNKVAQDILKQQLNKNKLNTNMAKNIIMFLGDGMSIPTITATRVLLGGEEKQLTFEKYPYVGLSKTYCANTQVADSACTSTAYLGGVKGNYATIGVTAAVQLSDCSAESDSSNHVHSIGRWAQAFGMATGLITTTTVTHASPAGIYAHTANRNWENDAQLIKDGADPNVCKDIARQLIENPVGHNLKVIMGGGRREFLPNTYVDISGRTGKRTDNKNLIQLWKDLHANNSASYIQTKEELENLPEDTEYLFGLFQNGHLDYHADSENSTQPTLSEMVDKALDILEKDNQRYFLFVEGGRIDHAHHDTEAYKAIDETIEFNKAIELARKRTSEDDTLIIVTADHSHTMTVSGYSSRKNDIFGINDSQFGSDELPYSTISYANGPGFENNFKHEEGSIRRNLLEVDMRDKNYKFPSTVPLESETHGGDDVSVYASGPWAHIFTGVFEQNFIPHAMKYAACIGDGLVACERR